MKEQQTDLVNTVTHTIRKQVLYNKPFSAELSFPRAVLPVHLLFSCANFSAIYYKTVANIAPTPPLQSEVSELYLGKQ